MENGPFIDDFPSYKPPFMVGIFHGYVQEPDSNHIMTSKNTDFKPLKFWGCWVDIFDKYINDVDFFVGGSGYTSKNRLIVFWREHNNSSLLSNNMIQHPLCVDTDINKL